MMTGAPARPGSGESTGTPHRPRSRAGSAGKRIRQPISRLHPRALAPALELGQLGAGLRGSRLLGRSAPSWPDDPETVEEARANPDVFAKKTLGQVADHTADVIGQLDRQPAVLGHSTGGLLAQMIADRGLSAATVAPSPRSVSRRAPASAIGAEVGLAGAREIRSIAAARSRSPSISSSTAGQTRSPTRRRSSCTTSTTLPRPALP